MAPPGQIEEAVRRLKDGDLVGLPTETVYGLAADAENELAVRRIFAVKGRPASHPLIIHLPAHAGLQGWAAEVPALARDLAAAFWPGPLTLVLRRGERVIDAVTAGQQTVALRVPAHPLAQAVLDSFGGGLAAPSANRFGHVSPTTADHVRSDLGPQAPFVLDGGPCAVGVESTIIGLSDGVPRLLRPGGVPREAVEAVIGRPLAAPLDEVRAPGLLAAHYAPAAGVALVEPGKGAARAAAEASFGRRVALITRSGAQAQTGVTLVVHDHPADLARNLYANLRALDQAGIELVVVELPPEDGMGLAVRDRLTRAARGRAQTSSEGN